jgi:hypothetical protein
LGGSGAKLALSVAEVMANMIGLLPHDNKPLRKPKPICSNRQNLVSSGYWILGIG